MAWIYLQELEGFNSAYLHGLPQPLIVRLTDTARECFCREWRPGKSQVPRFGMILEPSREQPFGEKSISFPGDSPARISVLRGLERVWVEREAAFSLKSSASQASFDRPSFSWKTSQLSLFEALTAFSWSSLRSGTIVDGRLYQPASLVPRTCAKDGGYLPTPTARDYKSAGLSRSRKANIERRQGLPLSVWFKEEYGGNLHPAFLEWMMGYPPRHTVLKDWVMQWFRCRSARPLKS